MALLEHIWESFWLRFCVLAVFFQGVALVIALNSDTEGLRTHYYNGLQYGVPYEHGELIFLLWPFD